MPTEQQKSGMAETLRHALAWLIVLSGLSLAGWFLTQNREWIARIVGAAAITVGVMIVRCGSNGDKTEGE